MTQRICIALLCGILTSSASAQFFTSCSRHKTSNKPLEQQVMRAQENEEVPWVKLVKSEEKKVKHDYAGSAAYGAHVPAFSQGPIPTQTASAFSVRFFKIQRAIYSHAVLYGYTLIVPNPSDLTKLRNWEIDQLATFFKQGTTYGTTHKIYLNTATKKYQDAMVEVRFHSQTSQHTALWLIDCRNRKIYLFVDRYPKRLKNK